VLGNLIIIEKYQPFTISNKIHCTVSRIAHSPPRLYYVGDSTLESAGFCVTRRDSASRSIGVVVDNEDPHSIGSDFQYLLGDLLEGGPQFIRTTKGAN
jgi:hypothetical protein